MKTILLLTALILTAAAAIAGTVVDLQTGAYAEGDPVTVNAAVVTGVTADGLFISEDPVVPASGVFVATGATPSVVIGDLVHVKGLYREIGGRTVLVVTEDPTGFMNLVGPHMGEIFPLSLGLDELLGQVSTYEGCYVQVDEGLHVAAAPDGQGVWRMGSFENPLLELVLEGLWYDPATVAFGDCASCARGVLTVVDGEPRLLPHEGGICTIDCTVGGEVRSFGEVKALFR